MDIHKVIFLEWEDVNMKNFFFTFFFTLPLVFYSQQKTKGIAVYGIKTNERFSYYINNEVKNVSHKNMFQKINSFAETLKTELLFHENKSVFKLKEILSPDQDIAFFNLAKNFICSG